MIGNQKLWLSILALEVVGAALYFGFFWERETTPSALPYPDTQFLDPIATEEIKTQHQQTLTNLNADTLHELGRMYAVFGFFPEADTCYKRAAAMKPRDFEIAFWWGIVADRLGKVDQAIKQFTIARGLAPTNEKGQCSYHLGRNYLRNENIEKAENAFRLGAESYEHARYALAKLLVELGRHEEAKPMTNLLLVEYPDGIRILQLAAKIAIAEGDLVTAEDFVDRSERGTERFHSDELAYQLIGLAEQYGRQRLVHAALNQQNQGNYQKALEGYKRVNKSQWTRNTTWNIALMEINLNNYASAIAVIEDLIQRDGATAQRLDILGEAYKLSSSQNNDPTLLDKAVDLWLEATNFPNKRNIHLKLANYYQEKDNKELEQNHRALQSQTVGIRLFRDGNLVEAQKALVKAVELDPSLAQCWYYLGEIAHAAKKTGPATQAFEKCLEIKPYHGRAAAKLALLNNANNKEANVEQPSSVKTNGGDSS